MGNFGRKSFVVFNRQKVLLSLIESLSANNKSSRFMIVKNLFLLKKEGGIDTNGKFYDFFPYNYGPFSYQCFADINSLRKKGLLDEDEKSPNVTPVGKKYLKSIDLASKSKIDFFVNRFGDDKRGK